MTNPAVWSAALDELLADGAWHALDDIVEAVGERVPEGHAVRTAERHRRACQHAAAERTRGTRDSVVRTGRRAILSAALGKRAGRGTVERRRVDGRLEYRAC